MIMAFTTYALLMIAIAWIEHDWLPLLPQSPINTWLIEHVYAPLLRLTDPRHTHLHQRARQTGFRILIRSSLRMGSIPRVSIQKILSPIAVHDGIQRSDVPGLFGDPLTSSVHRDTAVLEPVALGFGDRIFCRLQ